MRQTPYFDLCISVLLQAPEADMPFLTGFFKQRAELEIPRKPKVYSIGGSDSDGKRVNFLDWLNLQRQGQPAHVRWFFLAEIGVSCLELTSGTTSKFYSPELLRSPEYALTGSQLYSLINAQDDPSHVRARVVKKISELLNLNGQKIVAQDEFKHYLESEEWEQNGSGILMSVLDEIQVDCALLGNSFHVPDAMKDVLMQLESRGSATQETEPSFSEPNEVSSEADDEESKRMKARTLIQNKLWYPTEKNDYWEFYFYKQIELAAADIPARNLYPAESNLTAFSDACKSLAAFAKRIHSPFDEAFRLGAFFIDTSLPSGTFDETHWEKVKEILKSRAFSDKALEISKTTFDFGFEFSELKLSDKAISCLFAYDITDVFGGMGSWNDGYLENAADNEEMNRLNTTLQISKTRLWMDILSFTF